MGRQRGPTPDIYKDEFPEQTPSARRAEAPDLSARPAPSLPRGPGGGPAAVTPTSDRERPFPGARCVCPRVPLPPRPGEDAGSPCGAQTSGSLLAGRRLCDLGPGAPSLCLGSRSGRVRGRFLGSPSPAARAAATGPGPPPHLPAGPPPPRAAPYLGLEAENQQVQQPVGDKSGRERGARGERGAGARPAGTGRRYSQAAQRRAGAAHGARPGARGAGRDDAGPRAHEPGAAASEGGSRAGARRRCRRGSAGPGEGRADRAESLCAAPGAGGRWRLRSQSRRRVTGRQGG